MPLADDETEAWRALVAEVADAVAHQVAPRSDTAQLLANRWAVFVMRQFGGDVELALKRKAAYVGSTALQESSTAAAGVTPTMMQFIGNALIRDTSACLVGTSRPMSSHAFASPTADASLRKRWLVAPDVLESCPTTQKYDSEQVLHDNLDG